MSELYRHIGPDTDVPAGDIGVGGREVAFLFGQYKRLQNQFTGVLTGKGLSHGGSLIRPEATGYGLVFFAENMLETISQNLEGKVALVSGSGNVAQHAVEMLIKKGAKVVTVSDSSGFVHDEGGITQEKLEYIKELKNVRRGRISEYAEKFGGQFVEGAKPWGVKADLAFPCATQNEIDASDAQMLVENGIIAVAEGANMPCDTEAVDVFHEAKVLFAPGKASNAGGVAVSGLEMTQNSMRLSWTEKEVLDKLENIMKSIHEQCRKYGDQDGYINYVKGANIAGFIKVADAMLAQGIV